MPLIRLVNHSHNNKWHFDKMIFVENVPEKFLFVKRTTKEGVVKSFLKTPWTVDISDNIPSYVKDYHQPEPMKINLFTPAPEKGLPALEEEVDAYALVLDYQNGAGERMWLDIARLIDSDTPRGERIPEPVVVCGGDNDHRNYEFSVPAEDIPVVRLRAEKQAIAKPNEPLSCVVCNKAFDKEQGLRMHKMKTGHKDKVAVGV
jgi:hypothetical protein